MDAGPLTSFSAPASVFLLKLALVIPVSHNLSDTRDAVCYCEERCDEAISTVEIASGLMPSQ
jgi:hypothetical protein